jgi:hypothetical protein
LAVADDFNVTPFWRHQYVQSVLFRLASLDIVRQGCKMKRQHVRCVILVLGPLVAVFVVFVVIPTTYLALHRAFRHNGDPASIRLTIIYNAIRAYDRTKGRLPQAHTTMEDSDFEVSWRVLLLPQIGYQDIYEAYEFDQPWSGQSNTRLASASAAWTFTARRFNEDQTVYSDFVAVTGNGTVWGSDVGVPFGEIESIAPNLILAVQIENSGVHWMEPRDIRLDELAKARVGGSNDAEWQLGSCVLFADGHIWRIKKTCPGSELAKLATLDGARMYSRDQILGAYHF